jgi:hypothetical protein
MGGQANIYLRNLPNILIQGLRRGGGTLTLSNRGEV